MIRPATSDDLAFVKSSWLRSYSSSEWAAYVTPRSELQATACGHRVLKTRRSNGLTSHLASDVYWQGQRRLIERLVSSSNVSVWVADEPMVDGCIVRDWQRDVCHWIYTRHSARGTGIARALVDDLAGKPTRYTHLSRTLDVTRLPGGWVFDPFELMI